MDSPRFGGMIEEIEFKRHEFTRVDYLTIKIREGVLKTPLNLFYFTSQTVSWYLCQSKLIVINNNMNRYTVMYFSFSLFTNRDGSPYNRRVTPKLYTCAF